MIGRHVYVYKEPYDFDKLESVFRILGDSRPKMLLIDAHSNSGLRSDARRETITVRSETFDKTIKQLEPKESIIWLDTQGFEGHILSGATKALQLRPPICLEFWPYGMSRTDSYSLLKKALIESGYSSFFDLNENGPPVSLTTASLDRLYERLQGRDQFTDLLVL